MMLRNQIVRSIPFLRLPRVFFNQSLQSVTLKSLIGIYRLR